MELFEYEIDVESTVVLYSGNDERTRGPIVQYAAQRAALRGRPLRPTGTAKSRPSIRELIGDMDS